MHTVTVVKKKRDFRKLWITRINAAARINGLSYSQLMHGLKLAEIELTVKCLLTWLLTMQQLSQFLQMQLKQNLVNNYS